MEDDDDPSGFGEDEKIFGTDSTGPVIDDIELGGTISPTRMLIEIVYANGTTRDATGSIELVNLCEHDANEAYDSETRELDYSELGRELQLRVDALIDHSRFDNDESDGESDADVLKRYHGQKDE